LVAPAMRIDELAAVRRQLGLGDEFPVKIHLVRQLAFTVSGNGDGIRCNKRQYRNQGVYSAHRSPTGKPVFRTTAWSSATTRTRSGSTAAPILWRTVASCKLKVGSGIWFLVLETEPRDELRC